MTTSSISGGTRLSLLARARDRESAAWSELVRLYAPLVAYWCRRCGLDSHDAADCMQEVFGAVASSLGTYRPRGAHGTFRAWLWTITRNKARNFIRKKFRQPQAEGGSSARQALAEFPDESSVPEDEPSSAEQLNELLQRGLEQVRAEFEPKTWLSFWRTAIDGLPTSIVADQLGLTSTAVRKNRSRVMRRLQQQFADME